MAAPPDATLYVRLRKRIAICPGEQVKLGAVSRMLSEAGVEKELADLEIYRHKPEDGNRMVIDMLHIIRLIHTVKPGLPVEYYGDPQVLVMIDMKTIKPRITVLVFAWLLLFFGAGLAIMNFHADVSMREVHVRITELITGSADAHPLWFQIPYSAGIGLGMSLFFNHIFRKRFNEEPSPLEVELFTYQENVNAYVIADEMGKMNAAGRSGADE
ncbi:stage V sporulation protein AA [Paenibacillus sambharensis]|uniref:Stage V sporulation protein AA n=1 Tax=Paenibacillus sambharensis TaxID=1803190 RepID=A0A2W1LG92_9BACL|nr:stage V sporulation protein AA [Paenibacillus sambharensis]PZD93474.1 stage V sporulation protein AA [Paenibacillus sambharensis]